MQHLRIYNKFLDQLTAAQTAHTLEKELNFMIWEKAANAS